MSGGPQPYNSPSGESCGAWDSGHALSPVPAPAGRPEGLVSEQLTEEERALWNRFPENQRKIVDGVHYLMVEYDPFMELQQVKLKDYLPGLKEKFRIQGELRSRPVV